MPITDAVARIVQGTLANIAQRLDGGMTRTVLILVGPALAADEFHESRLYAADYDRRYRPQDADSPWAGWRPEDD